MEALKAKEDMARQAFDEWCRGESILGNINEAMSDREMWSKYNVACTEALALEQPVVKDDVSSRQSSEVRREEREISSSIVHREIESWKSLRAYGKSIAVMGGSDRGALCEWVGVVERVGRLAQVEDRLLIKFALSNATGALHEIISDALLQDSIYSWDGIKLVINRTLLTADEKSYLRNLIFSLKQSDTETMAVFCHRFKQSAVKGWDLEAAVYGSDTFDILMSTFLDALKSSTTMWFIETQRPTSLEEAFNFAILSERSVERQKKRVAAIEVAGVTTDLTLKAKNLTVLPKNSSDNSLNSLKTLQGEVKSLRKMISNIGLGDAQVSNSVQYVEPRVGVRPFFPGSHVAQRTAVGTTPLTRHSSVGQHRPAISMPHQHPKAYGDSFLPRGSVTSRQDPRLFNTGYVSRPRLSSPKRIVQCYYCGGDHFVRNCPSKVQISGN